MKPSKVLVTGASGKIGRALVPQLLDQGYSVRAQYVRNPGTIAEADWCQCDFLKNTDVGELVDGCDAVIHLAAEISDPTKMQPLNVDTTLALAREALARGAKYFAYASSVVVYGSPRLKELDENSPLIDLTASIDRQYRAEPYMLAYARSKVLAENGLRELRALIGIDILRPAVVADLAKWREVMGWSFFRRALSQRRRTQYVDVEDVAAAFTYLLSQALSAKKVGIDVYNICDQDVGTFGQLLDQLCPDRRRTFRFLQVPIALDLAKDCLKHRDFSIRYPLGSLRISDKKLRASGFTAPVGYSRASKRAGESKGARQ